MRTVCFSLLLPGVFAGLLFAFAEPPGPSGGNTSFTIPVVVNDKSGKPVSGLQQADFTLLDNDKPQTITSFKAVSGGARADEPIHAVILIDAINTGFERVGFVRNQLEKFLLRDNGRLAIPTSIGLMTDEGVRLQNAPSQDGNALNAALNQQETALRSLRRSQGFYGAVDRSDLSIRELGEVANAEESKPGRKLVVLISPGWPLLSGPEVQLNNRDEEKIFRSIVGISTMLRRAQMTLYSVDPLGTADAGTFRTFYYKEFVKGVTSPQKAVLGDLALQVLATQSGGRVLNSSNDVTGGVATCFRDAASYYLISFTPSEGDGANEYHALQVKLSQHELKAQMPTGYYAHPVLTGAAHS